MILQRQRIFCLKSLGSVYCYNTAIVSFFVSFSYFLIYNITPHLHALAFALLFAQMLQYIGKRFLAKMWCVCKTLEETKIHRKFPPHCKAGHNEITALVFALECL